MKNLITACCFLSLALPPAVLRAESAAAILTRMDEAAPGFHAMSASMQLTTYVAVIQDKTVEDGTLIMQRVKAGSVRVILDFSHQKDASANRIIAIMGNIVQMVYTNAKTYQNYNVGNKSDVLNQFLLLGFGSSGKELSESYDVTAEGTEKIDGQDATKLLLTPKSGSVKDRLVKVEMWIPANAAYPIQQQFYEPANNYKIAKYSNIKINPPIKGKQLEFNVPKNFKKSS